MRSRGTFEGNACNKRSLTSVLESHFDARHCAASLEVSACLLHMKLHFRVSRKKIESYHCQEIGWGEIKISIWGEEVWRWRYEMPKRLLT